jgi:hypothetical protein
MYRLGLIAHDYNKIWVPFEYLLIKRERHVPLLCSDAQLLSLLYQKTSKLSQSSKQLAFFPPQSITSCQNYRLYLQLIDLDLYPFLDIWRSVFIRTVIPFPPFWFVLYALFRFVIDRCSCSVLSSENKLHLLAEEREHFSEKFYLDNINRFLQ